MSDLLGLGICGDLDVRGAPFVVPPLPDPCSLSCKSINISIGLTTTPMGSICEAVFGPDDVLTSQCTDPGVMYIIQISDEHGELVFETPMPIAFTDNLSLIHI